MESGLPKNNTMDMIQKRVDFYINQLSRVENYAKILSEAYENNPSAVDSKTCLILYGRILDTHERILSLVWDMISKTSVLYDPDEYVALSILRNVSPSKKRYLVKVLASYATKEE